MTLTISTDGAGLTLLTLLKPEVRAALETDPGPDYPPAEIGLLPGDADEYIITNGGLKGPRGHFTRDETGAVVASTSLAGCSSGFGRSLVEARIGRTDRACGESQYEEGQVSYFMRTLNNAFHREELFDRFARLDPAQPPLWGRLTAPTMLAHLCDQMRMPFRDNPSAPIPGPQRYPILQQLILYLLPWPKGTIQGPPEAFETTPAGWSADLATLKELVDQFVNASSDRRWPDHPNFGPMNHRVWGFFSYRHFDHHLRQFGV